ncbi:cupin domain-containing protein [Longispora albida]|uniref:cupin domain-containing protein n=1 Tax=Longispora albida TaxID=203523 RepID=UPI00036C1F00|nr:cupin domain-containing protein [Longispora albida]
MTVATLAAATEFNTPEGFVIRTLAAPSRGSRELAMWELTLPGGGASLEHSVTREELFLVRSGRLTITIAGVDHAAGPGDVIMVPPATKFQIRNGSDTEEVTGLVVTSAGIIGMLGDRTISPPWAQ